ncbi:hypothetical protein BC830DRAFT_1084749 [Chytriomyces sp. MP71]|nr:hypothetical protein BC830DRAFT_1084749 [Chytriomyces sp. MP71]
MKKASSRVHRWRFPPCRLANLLIATLGHLSLPPDLQSVGKRTPTSKKEPSVNVERVRFTWRTGALPPKVELIKKEMERRKSQTGKGRGGATSIGSPGVACLVRNVCKQVAPLIMSKQEVFPVTEE